MNHQLSHGQTEPLELDLVEESKQNKGNGEPRKLDEPNKIVSWHMSQYIYRVFGYTAVFKPSKN
jgi:hypothetical protein